MALAELVADIWVKCSRFQGVGKVRMEGRSGVGSQLSRAGWIPGFRVGAQKALVGRAQSRQLPQGPNEESPARQAATWAAQALPLPLAMEMWPVPQIMAMVTDALQKKKEPETDTWAPVLISPTSTDELQGLCQVPSLLGPQFPHLGSTG